MNLQRRITRSVVALSLLSFGTPFVYGDDDVCTRLFSQGYYDTNSTFTSQQSFAYIKHVVCDNQSLTYQQASSASFNLGIPIPDVIDIGIGGSTNSSNFLDRKNQFCQTDVSNMFANSALTHEVKTVSAAAAQAMTACLTRNGFHAAVTPAVNLNGFAIRAVNNMAGDNTIGGVSITAVPQNTIKCQADGSDVDRSKRYISPHNFTCQKPADTTVLVTMNTDRGDLSAISVYGTDQVIPDMVTGVAALQNQVKNLNTALVSVNNQIIQITQSLANLPKLKTFTGMYEAGHQGTYGIVFPQAFTTTPSVSVGVAHVDAWRTACSIVPNTVSPSGFTLQINNWQGGDGYSVCSWTATGN